MTALEVLDSIVTAEHAALYAYGVVGGHLDEHGRRRALACYDDHLASRDRAAALLRQRGAVVPGPSPAYRVVVDTAAQALVLAAQLEDDLAARWHDVVASTTETALRTVAVAELQACAVRGARWRVLAGTTPATPAFPGPT